MASLTTSISACLFQSALDKTYGEGDKMQLKIWKVFKGGVVEQQISNIFLAVQMCKVSNRRAGLAQELQCNAAAAAVEGCRPPGG